MINILTVAVKTIVHVDCFQVARSHVDNKRALGIDITDYGRKKKTYNPFSTDSTGI